MKRLCRSNLGFTLVELVVAIAVMAILAAVVTTAGIGVRDMVRDNRNKTTVQSFFTYTRNVMSQINNGTTIYGIDPTAAEIGELLERASGIKSAVGKSVNADFAIRNIVVLTYDVTHATIKPDAKDDGNFPNGIYVAVRHSNPEVNPYPAHTKIESETNAEWFVEAVYIKRDGKIYTMTRYSPGVETN